MIPKYRSVAQGNYQPNKLSSFLFFVIYRVLKQQFVVWRIIQTCCVDMVSRVVTPSDTLAGTALGSSQKETQDTMTNMQQGT